MPQKYVSFAKRAKRLVQDLAGFTFIHLSLVIAQNNVPSIIFDQSTSQTKVQTVGLENLKTRGDNTQTLEVSFFISSRGLDLSI